MNIFDYNFNLFCEIYIDISKYDEDIYIRQLQNNEIRFILYDCVAFNLIQRNYDIYKRKLYIIVYFIKKYKHIFDILIRNTIYTNYKFLVNFINIQKHEDIHVR